MMIAIPEASELCRVAESHVTEQGTTYTQDYHRLLSHVREQRMRMLEIGLYNGGSLRMWRDYLPNTVLHGIDIDARTLAYEDEVPNSKVRLVDQGSAAELDDGGHT